MQNMPDYSDLMRLAQTPQGQQFLSLLQKADAHVLNTALANVKTGDYNAAKEALSGILNTPEAQALLNQLGR